MPKKKLLVIDDSETNLLLFESMFEDDPRIEVSLRDSGKAILEYCLNDKPDLILLDLMMPDINGYQVLDMIQSSQKLKDIPVIIISAIEAQENINEAMEKGAIDYIIKPIDFEENSKMILRVLGLN